MRNHLYITAFLRIGLFLLVFLSHGPEAYASDLPFNQCDHPGEFKKALHVFFDDREHNLLEPKSRWIQNKLAHDHHKEFDWFVLPEKKWKDLPVYQKSLGIQHPELIQMINELNPRMGNGKEFFEAYRAKFGYKPSYSIFQDYLLSRENLLSHAIQQVSYKVGLTNQALGESLKQHWQSQLRHYIRPKINQVLYRLSRGKDGVYNAELEKIMLEADANHMRGFIGEIRSTLSLPDVHDVSVHFGEMLEVEKVLPHRLNLIRKELLYEEDPLAYFEAKYFQIPTMHPPQFNHMEYVRLTQKEKKKVLMDKLDQWVRSKEIDVVRKNAQGKKVLVEIKTNASPISMNSFQVINPNPSYLGKSPKSQIEREMQILEFLGIKDQFEFEYHALGGLSSEVEQWLTEHGVRIIK